MKIFQRDPNPISTPKLLEGGKGLGKMGHHHHHPKN
jgi:hypothetical protein